MSIKAITWNIKAGKNSDDSYPKPKTTNLDKIVDVILSYGISIICLQEVDVFTIRSGGINQVEYIVNKLKKSTKINWYFKFHPALKFFTGFYGNAIISRFPLTTALKLNLPKVKGLEDRSFLLVNADLKFSAIYVGTFHLGLKGDQIIQAQMIKSVLKDTGYDKKKLLIGGDLNDVKYSKAYNIMKASNFSMKDAGPFNNCTIQCYNNPNDKKIDFWFTRNIPVNPLRSNILEVDISDHRPVLVKFYV